jgi:hypothetical protein
MIKLPVSKSVCDTIRMMYGKSPEESMTVEGLEIFGWSYFDPEISEVLDIEPLLNFEVVVMYYEEGEMLVHA